MDEESKAALINFGIQILDVGDGKFSIIKAEEREEPCWIKILDALLIKMYKNHVWCISFAIYTNFQKKYDDSVYLKERAIITPINKVVDE